MRPSGADHGPGQKVCGAFFSSCHTRGEWAAPTTKGQGDRVQHSSAVISAFISWPAIGVRKQSATFVRASLFFGRIGHCATPFAEGLYFRVLRVVRRICARPGLWSMFLTEPVLNQAVKRPSLATDLFVPVIIAHRILLISEFRSASVSGDLLSV